MANGSIDRRFDMLKQRAAQESRAQTQEAEKGLTRQFSRLGGIGTGAFVKQQALAKEAGARRLGEATQNIEFQKLGEQQRQEDIQKQREFQTAERLGGQEFAAGQLGKQQEFARSERLGAQEFGASQAEMQRKYATGERVAAQDFQRGLFDIEQGNTREKLDLAAKQFGMENNVNFLNARLQIAEGIKKGLFGFDDLQALNSMFGMGGGTPGGGPAGFSATPSAASSEALNQLRSDFAKINQVTGPSTVFSRLNKKVERNNLFRRARELGITDEELQRAGISGY